MVRVIHFFNLKPGADEAQMLALVNQGLLEITKFYGCLERKTWKLLDANAQGQPTPVAAYLNEALWSSQEAADTFAHAVRDGKDLWISATKTGNDAPVTAWAAARVKLPRKSDNCAKTCCSPGVSKRQEVAKTARILR